MRSHKLAAQFNSIQFESTPIPCRPVAVVVCRLVAVSTFWLPMTDDLSPLNSGGGVAPVVKPVLSLASITAVGEDE